MRQHLETKLLQLSNDTAWLAVFLSPMEFTTYRQNRWFQVEIDGIHYYEDLQMNGGPFNVTGVNLAQTRTVGKRVNWSDMEGVSGIRSCWFLCVSPFSSRRAALQKYCTQPCLPKKVEGSPSGRPNLNGKLWMPDERSTDSPPEMK